MISSPKASPRSPSSSFTMTNKIVLLLTFTFIVFITTYQQNCAVISNLGPKSNGISFNKKSSSYYWYQRPQHSYDEMVNELADMSADRRVIILVGPHKTGTNMSFTK